MIAIETEGMRKLYFLDSIRGLAALMVVADHFLYTFYASVIAGEGTPTQHAPILNSLFHGFPFGFLVNGAFAVILFFVLSGFVLTLQFYETKDKRALVKQAYKRYVRLGVPVVAVVLVGYVLAKTGVLYSPAAEQFFGGNYIGSNWHILPHLPEALYQGLLGIFMGAHPIYNPVLWTMSVEFLGSFIIFMFAGLFGTLRTRWLFYIGAAVLSWHTYFIGFFVGAMLADLYANRQDILAHVQRLAWPYKAGLLAVAAVCASLPPLLDASIHTSLFRFLLVPGVPDAASQMLLYTVSATICMVIALASPRAQWFLTRKPNLWLGKHSFSMYLLHVFVISAFATWAFPWLVAHGVGYNAAAILMLAGILAVLAGACIVWTKYVDVPAITMSRRFGEYMVALEQGKKRLPVFMPRELLRLKNPFIARQPYDTDDQQA